MDPVKNWPIRAAAKTNKRTAQSRQAKTARPPNKGELKGQKIPNRLNGKRPGEARAFRNLRRPKKARHRVSSSYAALYHGRLGKAKALYELRSDTDIQAGLKIGQPAKADDKKR